MKHDKTTTDEQWKEKLTPEQYKILRQKGTERAFTGELLDNKADGTYVCGACNVPLFSSDAKYDSGSGWPSFFDVVDPSAVELIPDNSFFMRRTEVVCANCGGHLGHVFSDGPSDTTGQRYCINSLSLGFTDTKEDSKTDDA